MNKIELINLLIKNNIIVTNFKNPTVLKSKELSPIYFNFRKSTEYPEIIDHLMEGFYEKIRQTKYDVIMGVAVGALPFSERLSDRLKIPSAYVRPDKERKSYGMRNISEGANVYGKTVFLIEDVANTGGSIFEDSEIILNKLKAKSVEACSIFSYEKEILHQRSKESGIKVNSLINMSDILPLLKEKLTDIEYTMLLEWIEDPKTWYTKYRKSFITIPR